MTRRTRGLSNGFGALLLLTLGCGGEDSGPGGAGAAGGAGGAGAGSACTPPSYTDDLTLDTAAAVSVTAGVRAAIAVGDRLLLCGGAAVTLLDDATQTVVSGPHLDRCRGLAAAGDTRAIAVTESGQVTLFALDGASTPLVELDSVTRPGTSFFDAAVVEGLALVASGSAGLVSYSLAGDKLVEMGVWTAPKNARSIAAASKSALVLDEFTPGNEALGGTLHLLDMAGQPLASIGGLAGLAGRLVVDGTRAVALRPGAGFDVLEVGATQLTTAYSTTFTHGSPIAAALSGNDLVIASGSQLLRFELESASASLVSIEQRPDRGTLDGDWLVGVVRGASGNWSAITTSQALPLALGAGDPAPHLIADAFAHIIPSDQTEALIRLTNAGRAQMVVTGVSATQPFFAEVNAELATPRDGCPGQYLVDTGQPFLIWQRYSGATGETHASEIEIASTDPDTPFTVVGEINRPVPAVGDAVDPFELPKARGGTLRSQDYLGKVWLAKLYNPT